MEKYLMVTYNAVWVLVVITVYIRARKENKFYESIKKSNNNAIRSIQLPRGEVKELQHTEPND